MLGKQVKKQVWLFALIALASVVITSACAGTPPPPTPTPLPIVEPTEIPAPTNTPKPTPTPRLAGVVDTGMGGTLSVQGVVQDAAGNAIPNMHIFITAFEEGVYWDRTGEGYRLLGNWDVYTNETGAYAFNNLIQVEGGHHQIWLSGVEDGPAYETSGYYIIKEPDRVYTLFKEMGLSHFTYHPDESGDTYMLDIVMHPASGSAFSGVVWYEDADGMTKNYFASPLGANRSIELNRGDLDNHEYTIGSHFTSDGSQGYMGDLAGGTYYLVFHFVRSDGTAAGCTMSGIDIPPGEVKVFDLTLPSSACDIME